MPKVRAQPKRVAKAGDSVEQVMGTVLDQLKDLCEQVKKQDNTIMELSTKYKSTKTQNRLQI